MIKTVSIIAFVLVLILLAGENALACKCSNPPSVGQSFEQSAAIFYGTVESVESSDKEMLAVFSVEKSWKGADKDRVTVRTDTTSCGIDFKKGESYYLFAERDGDIFYTVPCRRHAGSQEEFLKNKPALSLQKVPRAFLGSSNLLIYAASITAAVFILAAVAAGLYFFKARKSNGLKKE
jgi:hypothetical protein